MFCQECGSKLEDGAKFCQKCGVKILSTDAGNDTPVSPADDKNDTYIGETEKAQRTISSVPDPNMQPQIKNVSEGVSGKNKSKRKFVLFGIIAVVSIIIFIVMNWNGKIDYISTVGEHRPFNSSQNLPYTYEEVLNQYIVSPKWEVRQEGNAHFVDISGTMKGIDCRLIVTIKVLSDPDDSERALIKLESIMIDDEKSPTQNDAVEFLLVMFMAYDEGYEDFLSYMEDIADLDSGAFDEDLFSSKTQGTFHIEADDKNNKEEISQKKIYSEEILYEGIPLSTLMSASASDIIADLGTPDRYDEFKLAYNDIEFDLNGETITRIESYSLDKYTVNGKDLEKNQAGLVEILGEPSDEEYTGDGYSMIYHFPVYSVYFELGEVDSEAWRICVLPIDNEQSAYISDSIQNNNYQDSDGISSFSEDRLYLFSGSYETGEGASINVSIYSSFDEGDLVGNTQLYDSLGCENFATIRDDNAGEGMYTLCFDNGSVMYIRFYQDSMGKYYADIQGLNAIYTNANPIETYIMTEQYMS